MKYLWDEFESYEVDLSEPVYFGYTSDKALSEKFMEDTKEIWNTKILSVSCRRNHRN